MSEFVKQHNCKERAIFQCCPDWIVIPVRKSRHFERGDNEPSEMQIHTYSCQTKNWQRAFHGHRGAGRLNINNSWSTIRQTPYSFDSVRSFWALIHRRMGIIEDSTKPCFRKNAWATFSGRSVSKVIRRKFFSLRNRWRVRGAFCRSLCLGTPCGPPDPPAKSRSRLRPC